MPAEVAELGLPPPRSTAARSRSRRRALPPAGHLLPGAVFIVWGLWWACGAARLAARAGARRPYRARAWHPGPRPRLRLLEPALKVAGPVLGIAVELWLDHLGDGGYQRLHCPPGSARAGRFDLANVNNWQHAAAYPAFILAGAVDLLGECAPAGAVPDGAEHAALALALALMAFLMGTHEKHEPLDRQLHWILFLAMAAAAAAVLVELRARGTPLAGAARAAAAALLGAWFCAIGAVMQGGAPAWAPGAGGAMLAPALLVVVALVSVVATGAVYALAFALERRRGAYTALPREEGAGAPLGGGDDSAADDSPGARRAAARGKPFAEVALARLDV